MAITIDPELEREIEDRATARGFRQASDYLRELLKQDQPGIRSNQADPARQKAREFIEKISGTATSGLSTDEIMAMTRGED